MDEKLTSVSNDNKDIDFTPSPPTLNANQKARVPKGKKEVIISFLNVETLKHFELYKLVASNAGLLNYLCVPKDTNIYTERCK